MEEKYIFEVEIKGQEEYLRRIGELRKENTELQKTQKDYQKALKDGEPIDAKQRQEYEKKAILLKQNQKEMSDLTRAVQNSQKAAKEATGSYNQLSAEYAIQKKQLNEMSEAERKGTESGRELEKQANETYQQMKALQENTGVHTLSVGDYAKATQGAAVEQDNMRKRLTDSRREMQNLVEAGQKNTERYKELSREASVYQDTLDKVNAEVKVFADDLVVLRTAVDATQALAAGFQGVVGVTQLFGVENEKLVESIARLQAIMAVTNSLQTVSNLLRKEARLLLVGKAVATKAVTIATMAWNAALALSTKLIIVATGGLVLLIPLIIALVKYFSEIVGAIKRAANWLMFWKKSTDEVTESLEDLAEMQERVNKEHEKAAKHLEFEIKLMKALGAEKDEIIEKERDLLELRVLQTEQYAFLTEASLEATREEKERAREAATNAANELTLFEATLKRQRQLEQERAAERRQAESERTRDELQAIEDRERAKIQKEREMLAEQLMDREQREELAAARLRVMQEQSFDAELELLNLQTRRKLDDEALTQSERAIIVEEFLKAKADLERQYALEEVEIVEMKNEAILRSEKEMLRERRESYAETSALIAGLVADAADSMGAGFKVMKELAIVEGLVNTYRAALMAMGDPKLVAAFPLNIVVASLLTAQGLGRVNQIRKQKPPKMAKGGIIGGRSHSSGGTMFTGSDGSTFEAEKGEYLAIVNKYDASRAAMLDSVNRAHGKAFDTGNYFARGGIFEPQASPRTDFNVDMQDILRSVVEEIASIPVVNDVRETDSVLRKVKNIQRAGDL